MEETFVDILLVEDNPGDARLLREMLAESRASDIRLTHVDRVGRALSLLAERTFDLVLLDLSLPDSFGFEGFVKIHRDAPLVPVVILTSFDDATVALRAVQEGAQDYLVKGQIDGPSLVRAARYAVERARRVARSSQHESGREKRIPTLLDDASAPSMPTAPPGSPRLRGDDIPVGTQLGNYKILGRLGQGGMGVVYEAENVLLHRSAAIKLMPESLSSDAWAVRDFLREARTVAQINHPNVVGIYDIGHWDDIYYIAMELIRGSSIQRRLSVHGPFEWREATRIVMDTCRGLAAAHAVGMVHRDIKPDNILLGKDGVVRLADFGLALAAGPSEASLSPSPSDSGARMAGTLHYMSPEQCRGERALPQSDIYSLGATYYAMLVGGPPFSGDNAAIIYGHCFGAAPDIQAMCPSAPAGCDAILRRAMARDPDDRYLSADHMAEDLTALLPAQASRRPA